MKYLKAYAKICLRHSGKDCDGCPFSVSRTGYDSCLRYILENPDLTQKKIVEYVKAAKEKREAAEAKQKELDEFWGEGSRDAYLDR